MARPPRGDHAGAWHHVMNRGGCKRDVFLDRGDRSLFVKLTAEAVDRTGLEVHAYCLMNNHYHLLVRTPEAGLGDAMQHLIGRYTQVFNQRHGRDGALFRGRYHSVAIQEDAHLLTCLRYIHRNPTNDFGIAPDAYTWSSHRVYAGLDARPSWLVTEWMLEMCRGRRGYDALIDSHLGDAMVSEVTPDHWFPESEAA